MCVRSRCGAGHHREGVSAGVGAHQLRVVQRAETPRPVLPDDAAGVRTPALAAQHDGGEGRPVVRLRRQP